MLILFIFDELSLQLIKVINLRFEGNFLNNIFKVIQQFSFIINGFFNSDLLLIKMSIFILLFNNISNLKFNLFSNNSIFDPSLIKFLLR